MCRYIHQHFSHYHNCTALKAHPRFSRPSDNFYRPVSIQALHRHSLSIYIFYSLIPALNPLPPTPSNLSHLLHPIPPPPPFPTSPHLPSHPTPSHLLHLFHPLSPPPPTTGDETRRCGCKVLQITHANTIKAGGRVIDGLAHVLSSSGTCYMRRGAGSLC